LVYIYIYNFDLHETYNYTQINFAIIQNAQYTFHLFSTNGAQKRKPSNVRRYSSSLIARYRTSRRYITFQTNGAPMTR